MRPIDADALVKKLINESPAIGMVSALMESWFYAAIKSMPTIDAGPVGRGRWIIQDAPSWSVTPYKCSVCSEEIFEEGYKYCPNCGSKMDGDGDDE